jgi:hypothetical protein
MLKQLKWDAKDSWMRYGWSLLVIPLVLGLSLVSIDKQTVEDVMLEAIMTGICALGTLYLILLPNLIIYSWLNGNQTQLYFSTPVSPWRMLISRLILIVMMNTVISIFTLQIIYLHDQHTLGMNHWIGVQDLKGIPDAVLTLCLVNFTFILCNLFVHGLHWARSHKMAFSWGFSITIYIAFMCFAGFTGYEIWIKAFLLFLLIEMLVSVFLIKRFAHLDG